MYFCGIMCERGIYARKVQTNSVACFAFSEISNFGRLISLALRKFIICINFVVRIVTILILFLTFVCMTSTTCWHVSFVHKKQEIVNGCVPYLVS